MLVDAIANMYMLEVHQPVHHSHPVIKDIVEPSILGILIIILIQQIIRPILTSDRTRCFDAMDKLSNAVDRLADRFEEIEERIERIEERLK